MSRQVVHAEDRIPQLDGIAVIHGVVHELAIQGRAGEALGELLHAQPVHDHAGGELGAQARQRASVVLVPMSDEEGDGAFEVHPVGAELIQLGRKGGLASHIHEGICAPTVEGVDDLVTRLRSEHAGL